jgi:hypothetical protein
VSSIINEVIAAIGCVGGAFLFIGMFQVVFVMAFGSGDLPNPPRAMWVGMFLGLCAIVAFAVKEVVGEVFGWRR